MKQPSYKKQDLGLGLIPSPPPVLCLRDSGTSREERILFYSFKLNPVLSSFGNMYVANLDFSRKYCCIFLQERGPVL